MIVKKTYLNLINFLSTLYIICLILIIHLVLLLQLFFITSYINRQKEIIELFKNPYWLINTIIIAIFSFYVINIKEGKDEETIKMQEAVRKGILAFMIAIFAHLELTVAPFWIVYGLAYYAQGYV